MVERVHAPDQLKRVEIPNVYDLEGSREERAIGHGKAAHGILVTSQRFLELKVVFNAPHLDRAVVRSRVQDMIVRGECVHDTAVTFQRLLHTES
jgi:hypothetical protein